MESLKVILTGSTGMVGEGVLLECLENPVVSHVLVINRRSCGYSHPKLKELLHADFSDLSLIESQITGYNSCFFCAGVTSIGKNEEEYTRLTYTLTLGFAKAVSKANPGMVFCYVSGAGTDSTEKGKSMWARVKGKTENDLAKLPFKKVYNFRPGMMKPIKEQKYVLSGYKYVGWLFPVIKLFAPNIASTIKEVALTMIYVSKHGYEKTNIEVKDILAISKMT